MASFTSISHNKKILQFKFSLKYGSGFVTISVEELLNSTDFSLLPSLVGVSGDSEDERSSIINTIPINTSVPPIYDK